jgi:hypothetical protein
MKFYHATRIMGVSETAPNIGRGSSPLPKSNQIHGACESTRPIRSPVPSRSRRRRSASAFSLPHATSSITHPISVTSVTLWQKPPLKNQAIIRNIQIVRIITIYYTRPHQNTPQKYGNCPNCPNCPNFHSLNIPHYDESARRRPPRRPAHRSFSEGGSFSEGEPVGP